MLFLFETSCSHRPSKTNGSTIGVNEFNTTQVSWFSEKRPVIATEEDLYYISGNLSFQGVSMQKNQGSSKKNQGSLRSLRELTQFAFANWTRIIL